MSETREKGMPVDIIRTGTELEDLAIVAIASFRKFTSSWIMKTKRERKRKELIQMSSMFSYQSLSTDY